MEEFLQADAQNDNPGTNDKNLRAQKALWLGRRAGWGCFENKQELPTPDQKL